jgi:VWFA-related protein
MRSSVPRRTIAFFVCAAAGIAAAAARDQQRPVIRARADLVTTDVLVHDGRGRFVPDLALSELEVFEDGVRQQVVVFTLSHGGRLVDLSRPAAARSAEGMIVPPARPAADSSGRVFVIVVDDLHMEPRQTPRVRDLLKKVAEELVHEGDLFAILSTGHSSIEVPPTYDRRRLYEAIGRITGAGLTPKEVIEAPAGSQGPAEVRHHAQVAFATAYDMMRELEKIRDRRKAFILISNGYDLNPFPGARARIEAERWGRGAEGTADPFLRQGDRFASADLAAQLAELTRAANRANTTIYAIDPRGLDAGPDIDQPVDSADWRAHVASSQDTLRVLADLTGGIAVVNRNDVTRALRQIDADSSDYYLLGYYSGNGDETRRRRTIEVKATRPGLTVRSRTSYTLPPAPR